MREYRVTWQRHGLSRRSVLRQSREAAERLALVLQGRMEEARPDRDPEGYVCCDGREDGCGGKTWAQWWTERTSKVPPLVWLRIDSREVYDWEHGEAVALPRVEEELAMAAVLAEPEREAERAAREWEDDIPW